jgi:D-sedoheptulose 7-phosphate isomerase
MIIDNYIENYLMESQYILAEIDTGALDRMIQAIAKVKSDHGRIFFLGVGGSAANASHAVNDFRKIAGIECYAPTDNVAELTARTNDGGWETTFIEWLAVSHLSSQDILCILSVSGGSRQAAYISVSQNLVLAMRYAKKKGTPILSIVGRDDGFAAHNSEVCVIIPIIDKERITPHTESMQSLLLHLIVTHPSIRG